MTDNRDLCVAMREIGENLIAVREEWVDACNAMKLARDAYMSAIETANDVRRKYERITREYVAMESALEDGWC